MKHFAIFLGRGAALVCFLAGCTSTYAPPPATEKMAKTWAKQHVKIATLREGRTLFVSRCIECHTLPAYWHYRMNDWPEIVDSMAHRASLKKTERDAVVAYLQAAREL
jgi:hypothetical protein